MRPHDEPHGLCSVDPITLSGLALAGAAGGGLASILGGQSQTPAAPTAPPTQPAAAPPIQQPQGSKPKPQNQQSSFIGSAGTNVGAAATAPVQSGAKSLLGQ